MLQKLFSQQIAYSQEKPLAGVAYLDNSGNYQDGGVVDVPQLDKISLPFAYESEEMAELQERILYYETSRGCPFRCSFL